MDKIMACVRVVQGSARWRIHQKGCPAVNTLLGYQAGSLVLLMLDANSLVEVIVRKTMNMAMSGSTMGGWILIALWLSRPGRTRHQPLFFCLCIDSHFSPSLITL